MGLAYAAVVVAHTVPSRALQAAPNTAFGAFVLLRRLGTGGMAETYLAERRAKTAPGNAARIEFGRLVCIKVILPEHAEDPEFVGWFFDEARIHARLHCDHIVQVYDFAEHEGRYYLVLEYVDGCELRKLMNLLFGTNARLPYRLTAAIGYELARALDCAHALTIDGVRQNLVHRDLSPHNVLLSQQGHAKLCDFGVAKARSRMMRSESGTTKGKVPYMSPEQIEAPSTIDGRTDLFALGAILYELLSGEHPFRRAPDDHELQIAGRILRGERPRLRGLVPDVPAGLCEVVEALLETARENRVASAAELSRVFERAPFAPTLSAPRDLAEYVQMSRNGSLPASALPLAIAGRSPRPPSGDASLRALEHAETASTRTLPSSGHAKAGDEERWRVRPSVWHALFVLLVVNAGAGGASLVRHFMRAEQNARSGDASHAESSEEESVRAVRLGSGEGARQPGPAHAGTPLGAPSASAAASEGMAARQGADAQPGELDEASPSELDRAPETASQAVARPDPSPARAIILHRPSDARRALRSASSDPAHGPSQSGEGASFGRVERSARVDARAPEARDARATGDRPTAAKEKVASVRVVVLPFGYVEVGEHRSRTPLEAELPAGSYVIRAGRSEDSFESRTSVKLRPGERKEVIVELAP